jgi:hypothetical protein
MEWLPRERRWGLGVSGREVGNTHPAWSCTRRVHGLSAPGAVRPIKVVPLEEVREAVTTLLRAVEDFEVEALAEHGADPAPRRAIGLRMIGSSEAVLESDHTAHPAPRLGSICAAIVGEQRVDADAVFPESAPRANKEVGRGPALLATEQLRVNQPAAILNRHMEQLPAHVPVRCPLSPWMRC